MSGNGISFTTGKWSARRSRKGNTEFISLWTGGERMVFAVFFQCLLAETDFADWYSDVLASSPFKAFFWEHPPLDSDTLAADAEFVLVDAPSLAGLHANPDPFRAYFSGDDTVAFHSLGGDALLVAPSPLDATTDYAHLAGFLRTSSVKQRRALWQGVARSVFDSLDAGPLWLSTSGSGVSWLHIRLDETPKYYQHRPYVQRRDGC